MYEKKNYCAPLGNCRLCARFYATLKHYSHSVSAAFNILCNTHNCGREQCSRFYAIASRVRGLCAHAQRACIMRSGWRRLSDFQMVNARARERQHCVQRSRGSICVKCVKFANRMVMDGVRVVVRESSAAWIMTYCANRQLSLHILHILSTHILVHMLFTFLTNAQCPDPARVWPDRKVSAPYSFQSSL